jgi:hypothetical protein
VSTLTGEAAGRVREKTLQPHVPTSKVLARLIDEAPPDSVSLAWLTSQLEKRAFGVLMLVVALFSLAPGVVHVAALILAFPAIQMILGYERPTLPQFLAARSLPNATFVRWASRVLPVLRMIEAFIHPRLHTPLQTTKRLVGSIVLLLAITLVWPVPLSNIVPALVIALISLAYIEEDGVLLFISVVAALVSLAITAAIVWATIEAPVLIERLWHAGAIR